MSLTRTFLGATLLIGCLLFSPVTAEPSEQKSCCQQATESSRDQSPTTAQSEELRGDRDEAPGLHERPNAERGEADEPRGYEEEPSEGDFEKAEPPGYEEEPSEGDFERSEIPGLQEKGDLTPDSRESVLDAEENVEEPEGYEEHPHRFKND